MREEPKFAIIGAGMSGILAAIRLQEAGIDFTVFEKADRVGGTWRENTYPGIACDVPSHIYSYSFELNPDWSHFCSPGAEIQQYFEDIVDRRGIDAYIRFGAAVTSARWNGEAWEVTAADGYSDTFDWVIAATGILHHPKLPDIEGLDSFEGHMWHSARWNHDIDLSDKRVGVIGTGSTGTQITGTLAGTVAHYSLFQRTAQWVVPVEQIEYTEEERENFRTNGEELRNLHETLSKQFNDGFATSILDKDSGISDSIEENCRNYLETNVTDPELREKLRPTYRAACKRLVVSHNFYDAVQRERTEVVTEPIERIEPSGVRTADGRLHELDVLVLATGFQVDRFMRPMEISGVDGVLLDDVWSERPSAYLALGVHGFPNFFMLNGPNSPVGNFSLIQTAELQFEYIMQLVELWRAGQIDFAHPSEAAAQAFEAERVEAAKGTVWATGCSSWYLDDRGIPFTWPFAFSRFRDEMAEPKLGDYETV
ncbi:MAG: NAD(P)/FAD-dependent oxidoreductase [Acidimicrobiales bacterium]|nr:NAD(P)/FAD-dependent oxidoreductase [Acidimicrobiales bacterium]